jgi:hypothetical protein
MDVLDFAREPVWALQRGVPGGPRAGAGFDWQSPRRAWWVELRFC